MNEKKTNVENTNEMALMLEDIFALIGFAWHSIKRHWLIALLVTVSVFGLSIGLLKIIPPTYESFSRILTHPSATLIGIKPYEGRSSAPELIKSQENFRAVIDETKLIDRWNETKTNVTKLKEKIIGAIFGNQQADQEEMIQKLIYIMDKRIQIIVSNNVIQIRVQWHDAATAYDIAQSLTRRFLDEQFRRENAEYIVSIENKKKKLELMQKKLDQAEKIYKEGLQKSAPIIPEQKSTRILPKHDSSVDEQAEAARIAAEASITELERELSLKKKELETATATYTNRLREAENHLSELKLTLGERHPDVMKAQRMLAILSTPPPALGKLEGELNSITVRLDKMKLQNESSNVPRRRTQKLKTANGQVVETTAPEITEEESRFEDYQQAKLARNKVAEQLLNAQMEFDAGKSALSFRFQVTQPPVFAEQPMKPKKPLILAGAIIAGLFLGFFFAILIDIRSGKLLESWQISRVLKLPVLGEIDRI